MRYDNSWMRATVTYIPNRNIRNFMRTMYMNHECPGVPGRNRSVNRRPLPTASRSCWVHKWGCQSWSVAFVTESRTLQAGVSTGGLRQRQLSFAGWMDVSHHNIEQILSVIIREFAWDPACKLVRSVGHSLQPRFFMYETMIVPPQMVLVVDWADVSVILGVLQEEKWLLQTGGLWV